MITRYEWVPREIYVYIPPSSGVEQQGPSCTSSPKALCGARNNSRLTEYVLRQYITKSAQAV